MTDEVFMLCIRGTKTQFNELQKLVDQYASFRFDDDGPGSVKLEEYLRPLYKSGHGSTVTQFVRKQVQP